MARDNGNRPCHCDWFLIGIAILTGLLMVAASSGQIATAGPDWIDKLKPWQTAISAIVGFTGLIITTALGFYFTIRRRKADARMARESREHQAILDRQSRKEQADIDRKRDNRRDEKEARCLAIALGSEFSAIVRRLDLYYFQIATLKKKKFDDEKSRNSFLEEERARWAYRPNFRIAEKVFERIGILESHAVPAISTVVDIEHLYALLEASDTQHFFSDKTLSLIEHTGALVLKAAQEIADWTSEDFSLPSSFPIPQPQSSDSSAPHSTTPE